ERQHVATRHRGHERFLWIDARRIGPRRGNDARRRRSRHGDSAIEAPAMLARILSLQKVRPAPLPMHRGFVFRHVPSVLSASPRRAVFYKSELKRTFANNLAQLLPIARRFAFLILRWQIFFPPRPADRGHGFDSKAIWDTQCRFGLVVVEAL